MKIQVENLRSDGFRLELPSDDGPPDIVEIARALHLRGVYDHGPARIHLDQVAADELDLARFEWHLASGRLLAPGRVELREILLDLEIARGELAGRARLAGRIALAHGHFFDAGLELGATRVAGNFELTGLEYTQGGPDAGAAVTMSEINGRTVKTKIGATAADADTFDLAGLLVAWSDDALELGAEKVEVVGLKTRIGGVSLSIERLVGTRIAVKREEGSELTVALGELELRGVDVKTGEAELRLEHVALAQGLVYSATGVSFPRLALDAARVAVDGLARSEPQPEAPPKRSGSKRALDLTFLDQLEGRVDVDLTVDAKVPFLRRRVATHHFRVPIRDGTLDYKSLEGDLSALEDALLDFAVRDQRLVLEVNVPFKKHTLVEWPLHGAEVALAERNVVKLRTLPLARLPGAARGKSEAEGEKSSSFELTRLDFDPIDVELRLGGPGELVLGDRGRIHLGAPGLPAVGELRVSGALHHRESGGERRTKLRVEAKKLRGGTEGLRLGSIGLDAAEIAVGAVEEGLVVAAGLRPASVRAVLREVALRDVTLSLGQESRT